MLDLCRVRENSVEPILVETRACKPDVCAIDYFHDQEQIAIIHQAQDVLNDFLDSLVRPEKECVLPTVPRGT